MNRRRCGCRMAFVCRLTAGTRFVSADPKATGVFVLEGAGKKLGVWQNHAKWTRQPGTSFTIEGIPEGVRQIEVYERDGLRQRVTINGQTCVVGDLLPGETYMFLANVSRPSDIGETRRALQE